MQQNKLFVGNLSWGVNDDQLKEFFSQIGAVTEAVVIVDRMSGRSKGYGFVTFEEDADAQKAVEELDGKELDGRAINVSIARPRAE